MKSVKINGRTVTFYKRYGRVWAKIPSISKQYLGVGDTKKEAIEDVKTSLKNIRKYPAVYEGEKEKKLLEMTPKQLKSGVNLVE